MKHLNPGLLAAILTGPSISGSHRIFDPYGINETDPLLEQPPERIPPGQCHGCRTRISANKRYCLKCKTAHEDAAKGGNKWTTAS